MAGVSIGILAEGLRNGQMVIALGAGVLVLKMRVSNAPSMQVRRHVGGACVAGLSDPSGSGWYG